MDENACAYITARVAIFGTLRTTAPTLLGRAGTNNMYEDDKPTSTNRDDYHRCQWCKGLFHHDQCTLDPIRGYVCPNQCTEPYQQPAYESPLLSE